MNLLAAASRKWISFRSYSLFERALILPVFCLLALARAMVLCLPFKSYAGLFGQKCEWKSVCLPQAICACLLLRLFRIPFTTRFGVLTDGKEELFLAHVWVVSGTCFVTGRATHKKHKPVASFQYR